MTNEVGPAGCCHGGLVRAHAGITSGPATCPSLSLGRVLPAATNEMHQTTAQGPIGLRVEGVLACVSKNSRQC